MKIFIIFLVLFFIGCADSPYAFYYISEEGYQYKISEFEYLQNGDMKVRVAKGSYLKEYYVKKEDYNKKVYKVKKWIK